MKWPSFLSWRRNSIFLPDSEDDVVYTSIRELPVPDESWRIRYLRDGVKAHLAHEIPEELLPHHVPDSLVDLMMEHYLAGTEFDPEMIEMLLIMLLDEEPSIARYQTEDAR